ncbi:MAG: hypothetical protein BHV69_07180 [Bacteroidales bacterium 52_46]|nr:MAG: hypothetical protein BHV69_07180 [Bacteroidales bacterium 52_46]
MSTSRAVSLLIALLPALCSCSGRTQSIEDNGNPDQLRDRIATYWDSTGINAMDENMREQSIVDYLYIVQHADSATRREAWHALNIQLGNSLDRTVSDYLGDPGSPLYAPAMLDEYLVSLLSETGTDDTTRARAEYLLENIRKNRPGDVIADLPLVCSDGTATSLHNLIAGTAGSGAGNTGGIGSGDDNTTGAGRPRPTHGYLIIFYDPECESCDETIEALSAGTAGGHTIIAISVTDTVKSLPPDWISTRVLDPDTLDDAFYLPSLPAIYTVTPSATIIERH